MRPAPWLHLEGYRHRDLGQSQYGDSWGAFLIPFGLVNRTLIRTIASDGNFRAAGLGPEYAWEHVSVSFENRCPTWQEMDFVKDQFWLPDETVMQLHVPKHLHVNVHPYCLHLWRPLFTAIPLPPSDTVA